MESLGKKFDIIVMADIIEHVNNPVDLLKFYSQFLTPDGKMLITTPNAKRIQDSINIFLGGDYWINEEHTMWLCPKTMMEIIERAELKPLDFFWLKDYAKNTPIISKAGIINALSAILTKLRRSYQPNFMFVLGKQ